MVRMVEKIVLAALILLPAPGVAADQPPVAATSMPGPGSTVSPRVARDGKGAVRLEEVRITGSPEHPGILFFLPRARFHLLPFRPEGDGKDSAPAKDRERGAPSR